MDAKIIAYNPNSSVSNNVWWGVPLFPFKLVVYADIEFARGTTETFQEVNEDALKNRTIVYQRQRTENSFYLFVRGYLLDFFSSLCLCKTIQITFLETGETFDITNLRFEDEGEPDEIISTGKFIFDMNSIYASGCTQSEFIETSC